MTEPGNKKFFIIFNYFSFTICRAGLHILYSLFVERLFVQILAIFSDFLEILIFMGV